MPPKRLLIALILFCFAIAGIAGWIHLVGSNTADRHAIVPTWPVADLGQRNNTNCVDVKPEPLRYKFNDPNFPTGRLGEWYTVRDRRGNAILRVKVDLIDAVIKGGYNGSPGIFALFELAVQNLACKEPFAWKVRSTQGMWLGVSPRNNPRLSEVAGWIDSCEVHAINAIYVSESGRFHYADSLDVEQQDDKAILEAYGLPMPHDFPAEFPAGKTVVGQFYIQLGDVLGRSPLGAKGPKGDYRLPLVLGGYMGFARIDLGKAADWFKATLHVDPNDLTWDSNNQAEWRKMVVEINRNRNRN